MKTPFDPLPLGLGAKIVVKQDVILKSPVALARPHLFLDPETGKMGYYPPNPEDSAKPFVKRVRKPVIIRPYNAAEAELEDWREWAPPATFQGYLNATSKKYPGDKHYAFYWDGQKWYELGKRIENIKDCPEVLIENDKVYDHSRVFDKILWKPFEILTKSGKDE